MELAENLRARIAAGHIVMGTFVAELSAPAVAMILQQNDFDFMLVDTEHGCFDPAAVAQLILAGKEAGLCPLVRVPGPDQAEIKRVLDAGAEGIMVPMSQSLEDVQQVVNHSKYPPLGQRGAHFVRPHTRYMNPEDIADFMAEANRNLLTMVQIETRAAAELVDEIAAVEGVDTLLIGSRSGRTGLSRTGQAGRGPLFKSGRSGGSDRPGDSVSGFRFDRENAHSGGRRSGAKCPPGDKRRPKLRKETQWVY